MVDEEGGVKTTENKIHGPRWYNRSKALRNFSTVCAYSYSQLSLPYQCLRGIFYVRYSTLLHLPLLRFHLCRRMLGSNQCFLFFRIVTKLNCLNCTEINCNVNANALGFLDLLESKTCTRSTVQYSTVYLPNAETFQILDFQ